MTHPNFPSMPVPDKQFKLEPAGWLVDEYKKRFNREPTFSYKFVDFGLEDDEVVVCAVLDGSNYVPHWEFRSLMAGKTGHLTDQSSDAKATFGLMQFDLMQAAGPAPAS